MPFLNEKESHAQFLRSFGDCFRRYQARPFLHANQGYRKVPSFSFTDALDAYLDPSKDLF